MPSAATKPLHVRSRVWLREVLSCLLATLGGPREAAQPLPCEGLRRILVVRINHRIGNVLFLTPLLNALARRYPSARIDLVVGTPQAISLLEGMPQVQHVYCVPPRILRQPQRALRLHRRLVANRYEMIVSPNLTSSSDKLLLLCLSARFKVGFHSPRVFSPLTHSRRYPDDLEHEALIPLALMPLFGVPVEANAMHLDLRLGQVEVAAHSSSAPARRRIGIFRGARGAKRIPDEKWVSLLAALEVLDGELEFVDVVDPKQPRPLVAGLETLAEADLRVLASQLANLRAFICGDTGPMHLASASGTPTIALFKSSTPRMYGPLGTSDLAIELGRRTVGEVAVLIVDHLGKLERHPRPKLEHWPGDPRSWPVRRERELSPESDR